MLFRLWSDWMPCERRAPRRDRSLSASLSPSPSQRRSLPRRARQPPRRWRTALRVLLPLLGPCGSLARGGITDDERLSFSDGSWHRAQRSRVNFETACYFTHEPELPNGCQYKMANDTEGDWRTQQRRKLQLVALEKFYESTNGDNWRFNDNWMHGDPCFDFWYGITCDEHGGVIYLELTDNNLEGTLPRQMNDLVSMLKLDLSSTAHVNFGHANRYINRLRGAFPSIKALRRIAEIEVSGNELTSLPDLTDNANTLRVLAAARNRIRTLPRGLRKLAQLHTLELGHNAIVSPVSDDFGYLVNMRVLQLEYNQMQGQVSQDIVKMNKIEIFDVSHNPALAGEIPETIIVDWQQADYISVMNTSIIGYISELCYDVPFCWKFQYDTHRDMTWATISDVPDIVNRTITLALSNSSGR
eukprot:TRINITY_DN11386_c0_g1_i1.p1 TRINITY_DN11386_c0_g1~~TRINITY_DN11386_c0_g1_i1.p1  ORF type:complete len:415 (+),score=86.64 TRINITY_DN11386_c0_g1_i1:56-1300(+)